ncbi:MAG: hypothetical protein HQK84_12815 [Nitrospinae bacterium]|nr:hypothetical protein [Nitrospinota bacterium]
MGKFGAGLNRLAMKEQGMTQSHIDKVIKSGDFEKRYDFSERVKIVQEYRELRNGEETRCSLSNNWQVKGRGYERPEELVVAIKDETHQLQARLQLESGARTEGVGAGVHSNHCLKESNLKGLVKDPVTGKEVGSFTTKEKGGKVTTRYCLKETYHRLDQYIIEHGKLKSNYKEYNASVNKAAKETNQYVRGRGTHGLRYNFAHERTFQCGEHGMSRSDAYQQVSKEMGHNREEITHHYTGG